MMFLFIIKYKWRFIDYSHSASFMWLCSAGNMESLFAGSWLSSMRLYMIIRASAGYGWVLHAPVSALINKQASFVMMMVVVVTLPSVTVTLHYLLWCVYSGQHNVLITCARPHSQENAGDLVTCVITLLFISALLHVYHYVTENGGGVLWQHHRAAEDWTGVLSNGLLWQEVSFLPQGRTFQI